MATPLNVVPYAVFRQRRGVQELAYRRSATFRLRRTQKRLSAVLRLLTAVAAVLWIVTLWNLAHG